MLLINWIDTQDKSRLWNMLCLWGHEITSFIVECRAKCLQFLRYDIFALSIFFANFAITCVYNDILDNNKLKARRNALSSVRNTEQNITLKWWNMTSSRQILVSWLVRAGRILPTGWKVLGILRQRLKTHFRSLWTGFKAN